MHVLLSSALLLTAALQQSPPLGMARAHADRADPRLRGAVQGRVLSESSGRPLEAAFVEVVGYPEVFALTDSTGSYRLRSVPAGTRSVRARHLDHMPLQVEVVVAPRASVTLEFALELRPLPLPPMNVLRRRLGPEVDSTRARPLDPANDGLLVTRVETLGSSPGVAELGLTEALRASPGAEPPDPSDILYVRGAAADLKAVFLDGAPVYAPVHLGGMTEAFHPGLLSEAALRVAGASPRFDGGLSYVLDLQTRSGRGGELRTEGAVDMAMARAIFEGSLTSQANVLVAGRVVHGLGTDLWSSESGPSGYQEVVGRLDHAVGSFGEVGTTLFWNREKVRLDEELLGRDPVHWGNLAGSVRFQSDMPEGEFTLTAAFGDFDTRLPVAGSRFQVIEGRSERRRFAADVRQQLGRVDTEYGLSFERLRLLHTAVILAWGPEPVRGESDVRGDVVAAYVGGRMLGARGVLLSGGLRANAFLPQNELQAELRLSPRLSASIGIAEGAVLTLGAGRYHQYVQDARGFAAPDELGLFQPPDSSGEAGSKPGRLGVASANHLNARIDQRFPYDVRLSIDGFYKRFGSIPSLDQPEVEASGVDIYLRRAGSSWDGTLGYSHGWAWAVQDTTLNTGMFAGRHLVDAAVGFRRGSNQLRLRTTYATGLPYTAIPTAPQPPVQVAALTHGPGLDPEDPTTEAPQEGFPLGSYLRVEGELARTWRGGEPTSPSEITLYLRVLNGLERRDAMFVRLDPEHGGPLGSETTASLLPILGVRWIF